MTRTLIRGVRVLDPDAAPGTAALETDGDRISWAGTAADARERAAGAVVLDCDGAVVTPVFVDAHVHVTATGLLVDGIDLTGCRSPDDCLDAVAARAADRPGTVLWGHGWEEDRWSPARPPSRAALDRAAGGQPVYLTRIDVHSALVSSALLDRAPAAVGAAGWSTEGPLSADAHHHARRAALAAIDSAQRGDAQRAFLAAAARRGVGVVHECAGPDISGRDDLAALLALDTGVEVVGYWGEAVATASEAQALLAATGARGLAGDLFVDGSLGSRTAALRAPYTDAPGCTGNRYLSAERIAAHLAACSAAGVQAGFHVIGDAAADLVLAGLVEAVGATSIAAVRAARHRLEHLELVDEAQARTLAELGVVASVQPAFDAAWGGPAGMYAARLGAARAAAMNPFALLHAAGVALAFGSDAPVTPVDPWGAVRAAAAHSAAVSSVSVPVALAAHTAGGHHAARCADPLAGRLVAGAPASYALWDGAGPLDGAAGSPTCLRTVQRGRVLFDAATLDRATPAP
ncbi:amidohydrolase [Pseudonocardia asaccharolytica]|uniref:Amidohydrolase n=1 Tax=Pseudonocardia asaccharolytica DSM 44247 = NBRC 16224 TaxID=1123024 RepID=A0A511D6K4_9PSEU|nr:amidohydrolase family protein [Pseudonocardia asaccharolytica]GEL20416.1 amidohydrolase [Pseudonocardia asaccharolytica DSM 44247 = NBRC 16224]